MRYFPVWEGRRFLHIQQEYQILLQNRAAYGVSVTRFKNFLPVFHFQSYLPRKQIPCLFLLVRMPGLFSGFRFYYTQLRVVASYGFNKNPVPFFLHGQRQLLQGKFMPAGFIVVLISKFVPLKKLLKKHLNKPRQRNII